MSAAISTHGLTKHYGKVVALDNLDLEVEVGEVFGFLGPNGAGKSTTIKCLLDLIRPTAGTAEVLGFDVQTESLPLRRRVGFLPGDLAVYPNMTGRQVIEYLANLRGGVEPRAIDLLAERFAADLSRKSSEYSSGNRQKLGLIQAFMHEPDLVILDEPSTGLDPLIQQELHELILETASQGRTVFLSSHTLSEVDRVAGRVGIIRSGRLVEVARIDELKAKAVRRVDIEFASAVDPLRFQALDRVRSAEASGNHVAVTFEGSIDGVLATATGYDVVNLQSHDADLEDIFLGYYRDDRELEHAGGVDR